MINISPVCVIRSLTCASLSQLLHVCCCSSLCPWHPVLLWRSWGSWEEVEPFRPSRQEATSRNLHASLPLTSTAKLLMMLSHLSLTAYNFLHEFREKFEAYQWNQRAAFREISVPMINLTSQWCTSRKKTNYFDWLVILLYGCSLLWLWMHLILFWWHFKNSVFYKSM